MRNVPPYGEMGKWLGKSSWATHSRIGDPPGVPGKPRKGLPKNNGRFWPSKARPAAQLIGFDWSVASVLGSRR